MRLTDPALWILMALRHLDRPATKAEVRDTIRKLSGKPEPYPDAALAQLVKHKHISWQFGPHMRRQGPPADCYTIEYLGRIALYSRIFDLSKAVSVYWSDETAEILSRHKQEQEHVRSNNSYRIEDRGERRDAGARDGQGHSEPPR